MVDFRFLYILPQFLRRRGFQGLIPRQRWVSGWLTARSGWPGEESQACPEAGRWLAARSPPPPGLNVRVGRAQQPTSRPPSERSPRMALCSPFSGAGPARTLNPLPGQSYSVSGEEAAMAKKLPSGNAAFGRHRLLPLPPECLPTPSSCLGASPIQNSGEAARAGVLGGEDREEVGTERPSCTLAGTLSQVLPSDLNSATQHRTRRPNLPASHDCANI